MCIARLVHLTDQEVAMANVNDRVRDPLEEGEDKSNTAPTSGSREESMEVDKSDGAQDPAASGTTGLGRESPESGDRKGPGGVEGRE
jgi:hypothetical protein